jgi:CRISPR-associated endonuclease Csn1
MVKPFTVASLPISNSIGRLDCDVCQLFIDEVGRLAVQEELAHSFILGIDLGIASIGWALLDIENEIIAGCGARTFDAPETNKERIPKNQNRREARLLRRVIRRRSQRLAKVRQLCNHHLEPGKTATVHDPWLLRSEGLDRLLSADELRTVLIHTAKHRGFQSNRKGGEANAVGDDQKALKAMEGLAQQLQGYRTFGEMLAKDPNFTGRKRNRTNDYGRTPKRDWLRNEINILFRHQREMGSQLAASELEQQFIDEAFSQRPLQDSEHLVRHCSFEVGQKRTSKHAPSFERFRLLQTLVHMRLWEGGAPDRALTTDEIDAIERKFGNQVKLTYKTVRNILALSPGVRFRGVPEKDEGRDLATPSKEGSSPGIRALRAVLGAQTYEELGESQLDAVMFFIAFRESIDSIADGLRSLSLPGDGVARLLAAVEEGRFTFATGAAHVSSKACRAISVGLRDGLVYSESCKQAGYDHSSPGAEALAQVPRPAMRKDLVAVFANPKVSPIASPVARKALIESIKQVTAIVNEHPALKGRLPGRVHIELARDVGKGPKERGEIESGMKRRRGDVEKAEVKFNELFKRFPRSGELRIYELAQEQQWKCVYTGNAIDPTRLFDGASYQVDHILPWSRFGDNSYNNLTLCTAAANQAKKNRTPFEWYQQDNSLNGQLLDWDTFHSCVEALHIKGMKKRNYLLPNAQEREEAFRERNLNDTRFAAKLLLRSVELMYPSNQTDQPDKRRVFARPGALTALLRRGWGVEGFKKVDGKRVEDDRHHALDAIVLAATTESMVQRLTRAHQQAEERGGARGFGIMEPPWPTFRNDVEKALAGVFVSRAERRRARGKVHEETIRSIDPSGRLTLIRQTPADLLGKPKPDNDETDIRQRLEKRILKPERSRAIIDELVRWHLAGQPDDQPPLGPTGDPIAKIRAYPGKSSPVAVPIRNGSADRGEIIRTDVFQKPNNKGRMQYYLVPVYPHQLGEPQPPMLAIQAGKDESEWPETTDEYQFIYSVWPMSLLRITKSDGEVIKGYLRQVSRSTSAFSISLHLTLTSKRDGIGARDLQKIEKLHIDRLGRISPVGREVRTWHGAAYTSAKPPD